MVNISRTDSVNTEDKANDGLYEAAHEADSAKSAKDAATAKSMAFNKAYLGSIKSDIFKNRRLN